jgi:hypothetical protein
VLYPFGKVCEFESSVHPRLSDKRAAGTRVGLKITADYFRQGLEIERHGNLQQ